MSSLIELLTDSTRFVGDVTHPLKTFILSGLHIELLNSIPSGTKPKVCPETSTDLEVSNDQLHSILCIYQDKLQLHRQVLLVIFNAP